MRWVWCIFVLLALPNLTLVAQKQTPRDVVIESNRQELDNLLLRKPILTTEDKAARQAVLKQINDDFKALQLLNNRAMSEVTGEPKVDYKSLGGLIEEIGRKASRLKSNLVLPKSEVSKPGSSVDGFTEDAFRERMMSFDKVVVSFVTNPIFQKTNVIEVELAKKASGDLATIIENSLSLKKWARKLARKR